MITDQETDPSDNLLNDYVCMIIPNMKDYIVRPTFVATENVIKDIMYTRGK